MWSGYRFLRSRYCRIIGVSSSRSATKPALEAIVRGFERLGEDTCVADHGDEGVVAVPPRHHVHVQMVDDPGARDPALVEPDVEALGTILGREDRDAERHQLHR